MKPVQRGNPSDPEAPKKRYPVQYATKMVDETEVAEMIADETTLNPMEAQMSVRPVRRRGIRRCSRFPANSLFFHVLNVFRTRAAAPRPGPCRGRPVGGWQPAVRKVTASSRILPRRRPKNSPPRPVSPPRAEVPRSGRGNPAGFSFFPEAKQVSRHFSLFLRCLPTPAPLLAARMGGTLYINTQAFS